VKILRQAESLLDIQLNNSDVYSSLLRVIYVKKTSSLKRSVSATRRTSHN